ncbi:MAG: hypothetical protein U9N59_06655 [Campylobacterota bacterium]|nr:hypothetical protein [Campylobacterota bacterium]
MSELAQFEETKRGYIVMLEHINQFSYSDIYNRINKDMAKNEELEKQKELLKIQSINKYNIDKDMEDPF